MAVTASRVTATTTATLLSQADADGTSVAVYNADASAAVYLGGASVTSSTGFVLAAGGSLTVDLDASESLYGITASGTVVVHTLKNRA